MRTRVNAGSIRRGAAGVVVLMAAMSGDAAARAAFVTPLESASTAVQAARESYAGGDFVTAIDQYSRAIALIEQGDGVLSLELVEPLKGLSAAQAAAHREGPAVQSLRRAIGILRRNAGLYDPRQYELLLQLVDLHSRNGDLEAAEDDLRYLQRLNANADDDEAAGASARAFTRIADWRCRIGQFQEGRDLHRKALAELGARASPETSIEVLLGMADCSLHELSAQGVATRPGLFERYRGPIGRSSRLSLDSPAFRFHGLRFMRGESEDALVQAAQLAGWGVDPQLELEVLLRAGDWFQMKDATRTARRYYVRAEALARRIFPAADHPLSVPVRLFYPYPSLALRNRDAPASQVVERAVAVEFTVRADGTTDRERVLLREAGKSAVDETLSALRTARFRPRFEDGDAVDTQGVRHRQIFRESL